LEAIHILVSDIGGTNARYELWRVNLITKESVRLKEPDGAKSTSYPSLVESLRAFLSDQNVRVDIAVLGIAGPVIDESV
jgi:glucokinase